MKQSELVSALDQYFHVADFNEQDGWLPFMSETHRSTVRSFFVPEFWEGTWNGLMLNNTQEVNRVYLVVFPTADVLDTIIAKEVERGASGAMIFAHHPTAFEEKGRGFMQIPSEQLDELAEHHISYYNCHAPLDCHSQTSTGNAFANALGLNDVEHFAPYYGGLAGVIGTVPPVSFQAFAERVAEVCELPTLRYDQILHNAQKVHRVAVVAGGGGDPQFFNEAQSLGADTYVTGHWHLFADNEYAINKREEFQTIIPPLKINLIGASHYTSELIVMRDQMRTWFQDETDLEANLVRQDDPWG